MNDFLRVCEVAKLRGAEVRLVADGRWSASNCGKLIMVNMAELPKWTQFLREHVGADAVTCEWAVATWFVAHELGHYELHGDTNPARYDADPAYKACREHEANMFARRFLTETAGLAVNEAAESCRRIVEKVRDKSPARRHATRL